MLRIIRVLSPHDQAELLRAARIVVGEAPLFRPRMPKTGAPFRYRMTNCGELGWIADRDGYRYVSTHPVTGRPWPAVPAILQRIAADVAGSPFIAQSCLVNVYQPGDGLGWHQDRTEERFDRPIISVSLGATGLFEVAGRSRPSSRTQTDRLMLTSGDVLVMNDEDRLRFHRAVDVVGAPVPLLPNGIRLNFTMRQVR